MKEEEKENASSIRRNTLSVLHYRASIPHGRFSAYGRSNSTLQLLTHKSKSASKSPDPPTPNKKPKIAIVSRNSGKDNISGTQITATTSSSSNAAKSSSKGDEKKLKSSKKKEVTALEIVSFIEENTIPLPDTTAIPESLILVEETSLLQQFYEFYKKYISTSTATWEINISSHHRSKIRELFYKHNAVTPRRRTLVGGFQGFRNFFKRSSSRNSSKGSGHGSPSARDRIRKNKKKRERKTNNMMEGSLQNAVEIEKDENVEEEMTATRTQTNTGHNIIGTLTKSTTFHGIKETLQSKRGLLSLSQLNHLLRTIYGAESDVYGNLQDSFRRFRQTDEWRVWCEESVARRTSSLHHIGASWHGHGGRN